MPAPCLSKAGNRTATNKFFDKLGLAQNCPGEIILKRFIGRLPDVIDFLVHLHLLLGIKEGHESQQWIIGWAGVLNHLGFDPIQEIIAVQSLTWNV